MRPGFTSRPSAWRMRLKSSKLCSSASPCKSMGILLAISLTGLVGESVSGGASIFKIYSSVGPVDSALIDHAQRFIAYLLKVILVFQDDTQCFGDNFLV